MHTRSQETLSQELDSSLGQCQWHAQALSFKASSALNRLLPVGPWSLSVIRKVSGQSIRVLHISTRNKTGKFIEITCEKRTCFKPTSSGTKVHGALQCSARSKVRKSCPSSPALEGRRSQIPFGDIPQMLASINSSVGEVMCSQQCMRSSVHLIIHSNQDDKVRYCWYNSNQHVPNRKQNLFFAPVPASAEESWDMPPVSRLVFFNMHLLNSLHHHLWLLRHPVEGLSKKGHLVLQQSFIRINVSWQVRNGYFSRSGIVTQEFSLQQMKCKNMVGHWWSTAFNDKCHLRTWKLNQVAIATHWTNGFSWREPQRDCNNCNQAAVSFYIFHAWALSKARRTLKWPTALGEVDSIIIQLLMSCHWNLQLFSSKHRKVPTCTISYRAILKSCSFSLSANHDHDESSKKHSSKTPPSRTHFQSLSWPQYCAKLQVFEQSTSLRCLTAKPFADLDMTRIYHKKGGAPMCPLCRHESIINPYCN